MLQLSERWADIVDEEEEENRHNRNSANDFIIQYSSIYNYRNVNPLTLFIRRIVAKFDIEFDNVVVVFKYGRVKELTFTCLDVFYFYTAVTVAFKDHLTPYIKDTRSTDLMPPEFLSPTVLSPLSSSPPSPSYFP